jgi:hypothetical protein
MFWFTSTDRHLPDTCHRLKPKLHRRAERRDAEPKRQPNCTQNATRPPVHRHRWTAPTTRRRDEPGLDSSDRGDGRPAGEAVGRTSARAGHEALRGVWCWDGAMQAAGLGRCGRCAQSRPISRAGLSGALGLPRWRGSPAVAEPSAWPNAYRACQGGGRRAGVGQLLAERGEHLGRAAGWPAITRVCSDPAALEVAHPGTDGHLESVPRGGVGRAEALCVV